jgi:hypothetical protein
LREDLKKSPELTDEQMVEWARSIVDDPDPIHDAPCNHPHAITTIPPRKLAALFLKGHDRKPGKGLKA